MTPFRIVCIIFCVFFIFMIIVTFFSINSSYKHATKVTLTYGQKVDKNIVSIPLSAIHEESDKKRYVFVVLETEGAWGKEYICKKEFVETMKIDQEKNILYVFDKKRLTYPIMLDPTGCNIKDNDKVRF